MSSSLINFYFLLFCVSCVKGEVCFTDGVSWTDEHLQFVTPHINTAVACLDLCTKTDGCVAFTFLSKDYDQLIPEACITYTDIGKPLTCEECISGRFEDCQLCSQPVVCEKGGTIILLVPTSTKVECQTFCSKTTDCKYYTWFDNSAVTKNICFLLSGCGDTVERSDCMSGPPTGQGDYCTGIDYNELDDPTRNENQGKSILANDKNVTV